MTRDRTNRVVFVVLAVPMLAAGAYALLRSFGALGDDPQHDAILLGDVRRWVHRNADAFWVAAAIVCVLVAAGALWWLWAQRPRRLPADDLTYEGTHEDVRGSTVVRSDALSDAVAADLARQPGVERASVGIDEDDAGTVLVARMSVRDGMSVRAVAERAVRPALEHFCEATESRDVAVRIVLDYGDPHSGNGKGSPGSSRVQ